MDMNEVAACLGADLAQLGVGVDLAAAVAGLLPGLAVPKVPLIIRGNERLVYLQV